MPKGPRTKKEEEPTITVMEIIEEAYELFGNSKSADEWLTSPKRILGGDTPLEHLCIHGGADEIRQMIGRIAHGIPL